MCAHRVPTTRGHPLLDSWRTHIHHDLLEFGKVDGLVVLEISDEDHLLRLLERDAERCDEVARVDVMHLVRRLGRRRAVASLVGGQPTAGGREKASAAFGALLTTNNVTANLTRPNRQRFRTNLDKLLRAVVSGGLALPTA